jgi:excisionase family DNA binding protein
MEKRFLSIREAAKYSSLSTRFLYEKCQNRELRFSKVGKRIVIDSQDLHDFITQNTIEPVDDWGEKLGLK